MDTIKAIMTRRSVRAFTEQAIAAEDLRTLLAAAMNAPSAADGRPWQFVVVTDRGRLDRLAEEADGGNALFRQARAAVLICLDPAREGFAGFGEQDCACAAQNFQLAAHALGLGTVWIAVINVPPREAACRKILGLPATVRPFALFPVGYPAQVPSPEHRYDEARVHREVWS